MMAPLVSNAPAFSSRNPIDPGQVLAGKYRVERILGRGGMGVVVEARHIALDERVALKFLLPEYATHPEAAHRFLREARAAVKIKSEHVARVSDVGTLPESGAPYMVMEYLEGRDLSQQLEREGVLSVTDAVDFMIQGCEAITEAHSYGIIHRDLKPANLFLSKRPDGTPVVKVLDFGISKDQNAGVDNLTKTTAAMGSALYMSPEQMRQTKSADYRTDIYALGISLYELLAGRQPFYADTMPSLCAEILTGIPTPLRSLRHDVSEQLAAVIERAYARDPAHRFQSVSEFVLALAPFAPQRSQSAVERAARMAGLPAPVRAGSSSGIFTTAASPSSTGNFGAPAQAPPPAGYQTSGGQAAQAPGTAPKQTVPLPVMDPTTGAGAPPGWVPSPGPAPVTGGAPPTGAQIVPGPYTAPMSVRAAARFAQGGTTNGNLSTTQGQGGGVKTGTLLLAGLGFVAVGALVWGLVLRPREPKPPAGVGVSADTLTVVAPTAPSAPSPLAAPTPAPTASATGPAPAASAAGPDTAKTSHPTPPGSATAHPHPGHPVAPVRVAPQVAPYIPPRVTDPLDHPVDEGKTAGTILLAASLARAPRPPRRRASPLRRRRTRPPSSSSRKGESSSASRGTPRPASSSRRASASAPASARCSTSPSATRPSARRPPRGRATRRPSSSGRSSTTIASPSRSRRRPSSSRA